MRSNPADMGRRGLPQCQVAPGCTLKCATPGSTSGLGSLTLSITTADLRLPGGPTPGRDFTWNGAGRRPRSHVSGGAPPLFVADAAGNRGDHAAPSRRASISGAATDLSRPLTRVRIRWHGVSRETAPHRECPPLTAPARFCAAALDDTALRCPRTWRTGADGGIAVGGGQPTSTGARVTGTTALPHRGDVSRGTPAVRAFSAASGHRDRRRGHRAGTSTRPRHRRAGGDSGDGGGRPSRSSLARRSGKAERCRGSTAQHRGRREPISAAVGRRRDRTRRKGDRAERAPRTGRSVDRSQGDRGVGVGRRSAVANSRARCRVSMAVPAGEMVELLSRLGSARRGSAGFGVVRLVRGGSVRSGGDRAPAGPHSDDGGGSSRDIDTGCCGRETRHQGRRSRAE